MQSRNEISVLKKQFELINKEIKKIEHEKNFYQKIISFNSFEHLLKDVFEFLNSNWNITGLGFHSLDKCNDNTYQWMKASLKEDRENLMDFRQTDSFSFNIKNAVEQNNSIPITLFDNKKHFTLFPVFFQEKSLGVFITLSETEVPHDKIKQLVDILSIKIWFLKTYQNSLKGNEKEYFLAKKITSTLDLNQLLEILGQEIIDFFNPDNYLIALIDDQKKNLVVQKIKLSLPFRNLQDIITQSKYPVEEKDPFTIAYNEKKIIELSLESIHEYEESVQNRCRLWNIKHGIALPFINLSSIESLGTIFIFNHHNKIKKVNCKDFFNITELFFEQIKNARQYTYFKEQEKQFRTASERNQKILELAEKTNNLTSIELIYNLILESILELYGFDIGLIFMDNGSFLDYTAGFSKSGQKLESTFKEIDQYFKKIKGYEKNISDGATSNAFQRNNYFYFSDIEPIKKLPMASKDKNGIEILKDPLSLLIIPILKNQKPVGIFQFWSIQNKIILSETDIQNIRILSGFIGSAIANSKIYSLVEKQKKEVEEKNKIIELKNKQFMDELKLAREIQGNLVPSKMPKMKGINISAYYKPMEEIGGDYYDFIPFRDNHQLGIFISDVSGHGVPAALITSMVKTLMETSGEQRQNPSELLFYINQKITGLTGGNFLTAFYSVYDQKNKKLRFARGAHNPPFLIRNCHEIIELSSRGKILGIEKDIEFEQKEIDMQKGDKILFYTDGLTEAANKQGIMFEEILPSALMRYKDKPAREYLDSIYHELVRHQDGIRFEDDVCLIVLEITE